MSFDPSARATSDSGVFGLPHDPQNSSVILIPAHWDATTSYGKGTSKGPDVILVASKQIDLFDLETGKSYEKGYCLLNEKSPLKALNKQARALAESIREKEDSGKSTKKTESDKIKLNQMCQKMVDWVYETSKKWNQTNGIVGLVGGDHSTPLGHIRAVAEKYKMDYGILHIDAHLDHRVAYEGFTYSHASIMYNVMTSKFAPRQLVQVGIRDFSEEEFQFAKNNKNIKVYFDLECQKRKQSGESWLKIVDEIISHLPKNVYISFDIDGLDPVLCPHTGTPVPGGLSFHEAIALLFAIRKSGRSIIGFDLNEVAPGPKGDHWDGNVGARLLYKMCGYAVMS